jgi:hypothetical protein
MTTRKNSKKTESKGLSRREAILKLAALAASATSLGSSGLAQPIQTQSKNLKALIPIRAGDFNAKAIKVLILGDPEVYRMEFGHPWVEPMIEGPCSVHIGGWGGVGSTCGKLQLCNDNSCGSQSCPQFKNCIRNSCDKQTRSKSFSGTASNPFDPLILEKIKNDPFIKELYRVLGAKSSQELSNMLRNMIKR